MIRHRWSVSYDDALRTQDWLRSAIVQEVPARFRPELICVVSAYDRQASWPDTVTASARLYCWDTFELVSENTSDVQALTSYFEDASSFREVPAMIECVTGIISCTDDVLFIVNRPGMNHQRFFGTACHFGVVLGAVTIGVSRTLPCGRVEGNRVYQDPLPNPWTDEALAAADALGLDVSWLLEKYKSTIETGRYTCGYYVSVGNYISLDKAESVVRYLHKRRLGKEQLKPEEVGSCQRSTVTAAGCA